MKNIVKLLGKGIAVRDGKEEDVFIRSESGYVRLATAAGTTVGECALPCSVSHLLTEWRGPRGERLIGFTKI